MSVYFGIGQYKNTRKVVDLFLLIFGPENCCFFLNLGTFFKKNFAATICEVHLFLYDLSGQWYL